MKRLLILIGFLVAVSACCMAQLTLQDCRAKAHDNYPMIRQYKLIEQSRDFSVENASKGNLPQLSLSGKASYQSDVTKIPIKIQGYDVESMSRDQYNVLMELTQNLYDGGVIASQKNIAKANADVSRGQLDVSMYDINSRIDELFFGILLLDEQLKQNRLLQEDLSVSRKNIEGMMRNGMANQTDVDAIHVEQLNTKQQESSLLTSRKSYLMLLGIFIGENLGDSTTLIRPDSEMPQTTENLRPELQLYNAQSNLLDEQSKALDTRLRPKFSLFAQGAYGRPGLNMLKREFTPYYILGARLTWNFGSLYTRKNDKRLIEVSRQQIESNRETFLFNTHLQTVSESQAITDLRQKLQSDDEIVALRSNIRSKAERKIENGTLTVNEMVRQINAESEAKQAKAIHEIMLLKEIYKLKNIGNN